MTAWPVYDASKDPIEKREADARAWRDECAAREMRDEPPAGEELALLICESQGFDADLIFTAMCDPSNTAPTDPNEIRFIALERQLQQLRNEIEALKNA